MSEIPFNTLFIKGGKFNEVEKALKQWITTYSAQLEKRLVFKLYKQSPGRHVLVADENLGNELFFFLVNYMQYPVGIKYKVTVEGYTTGSAQNKLRGKDLFVFIPENDTDYDYVVVIANDNESYKVDFGGKISDSAITRLYQKPEFIPEKPAAIVLVESIREKGKKEKASVDDMPVEKRMKWIFWVIIALHAFNLVIIRPFGTGGNTSFEKWSLLLFFAMLVWFYNDYRMLQKMERYLKCLGLSAGLLVYLYIISSLGWVRMIRFDWAVATAPVVFLLVQWPLRLLFIWGFGKEPEVKRRPDSIGEIVYVALLILGPLFLTAGLFDLW